LGGLNAREIPHSANYESPSAQPGSGPALPHARPILRLSFTHITATSTRDSELISTAMDSPFETEIAAALDEPKSRFKPSLRAIEMKNDISRRALLRRISGGISKQEAREILFLRF